GQADVISPRFITRPGDFKRLRSGNNLRLRIQPADYPHQSFVTNAFQIRIGNRADDHLRLVDPGMNEGVSLADVAVNDRYISSKQSRACRGAEVDDRHVRNKIGRMPRQFFQERAGTPEKTKKQYPRAGPVAHVSRVGMALSAIKVAHPALFQKTNRAPRDAVASRHPESRYRSQNYESNRGQTRGRGIGKMPGS